MKKIVILTIMSIMFIIIILLISKTYANNNETTLVDTVISLSKGTSYNSNTEDGVYQTNNHEYRYIGSNVNNYVSFNNDLYRIIGVFDSNSHGINTNLVKVIRARELISSTWGVYNTTNNSATYAGSSNDWTGNTTGVKANANVLLNEFFLNGTNNNATYGNCSDWTYGDSNTIIKSKDCTKLVGYGIKNNTLRNYIEEVTWYLYGPSNNLNRSNMYLCERNQYIGCKSGNNGSYSGTTTAKIGLLYLSDYLYASANIASNNTSTQSSSSAYAKSNWLFNGTEYAIGIFDDAIAGIKATGNTGISDTNVAAGIRPVFYLKNSVYVTSGDGSFDNPYKISI